MTQSQGPKAKIRARKAYKLKSEIRIFFISG